MALKRALTLKNIVDSRIPEFEFTGEWLEVFGKPQRTGVWFIYGNSGHGKTSFVLMLIKYLSEFDRLLFVSYEEGEKSISLQQGILRLGLLSVNSQVKVCEDRLEDLTTRLKKRRSPGIVLIDSLQHSDFKSIKHLHGFTGGFPSKLFIIIGQAKGRNPLGQLGKEVLYLANQKIWIEGYRAFNRGRSFGEREYLTIWEHGAEKYWKYG
jgi:hypothetical protein